MEDMILDRKKRFPFGNRFFIKFRATLYKGWRGRAFAIIYSLSIHQLRRQPFFPAPMARITVAAPVTASPPA